MFDDNSLNGDVTLAMIPSGYQGFDWDNWYFIHRLFDVGGPGYESGTVSGDYSSLNAFGWPAYMSRGTVFSVLRLFAQSGHVDSGNVVTFEGFDAQDNVVATHTHTMGALAGGPYLIELPAGFRDIYKFKFTSVHTLAIDNLVVVI